jgi:hypothetical protein
VKEGQKVHFEARIIPVSDPTLKVEWFLNGQPIKQGNTVARTPLERAVGIF